MDLTPALAIGIFILVIVVFVYHCHNETLSFENEELAKTNKTLVKQLEEFRDRDNTDGGKLF